jgi:hypothetical protein
MLGICRRRREENFKMGVKEVGHEDVGWIYLVTG